MLSWFIWTGGVSIIWCETGLAFHSTRVSASCSPVSTSGRRVGEWYFHWGETHYRENWNRKNVDARWDTALGMALLSGFNTIGVSQLSMWDAAVSVARYLNLDPIAEPNGVLGWGLMHCIRSIEVRCQISTKPGRKEPKVLKVLRLTQR